MILFILFIFPRSPLRLSRAGEYAVRCALYLSTQDMGIIVSKRKVAEAMEIPGQFLGKIAQQLARSGILEIVQGANGGYRLLVPPCQLNLLDVLEAVIGEIFLNDCIIRPGSCSRSPQCSVHRVWERARGQLRETLRETTFAKLIEEESWMGPLPPRVKRRKGL